jgi:hypothetical protein
MYILTATAAKKKIVLRLGVMEITCLGQQQCLINKALHSTQLERELRIMSSGNGNGFVTENMVPRHRDGFCPTTRALFARRVQ